MKHTLLAIAIIGFSPALASAEQAQPADQDSTRLIVRTSNNLNCGRLEIDLKSTDGKIKDQLVFETASTADASFASVDVPAGTYEFGELSCSDGVIGNQKFDTLSQALAPIKLSEGKTTYAGTLVIQATYAGETKTDKFVEMESCSTEINLNGQESEVCRSVNRPIDLLATAWTVNFAKPTAQHAELQAVTSQLKVDASRLVYAPLETRLP